MGSISQQYCDMEREGCGTRGGWMRVAHLDMTQPGQECPSEFTTFTTGSKRLCGRPGPRGCVSAKFPTNSILYNKVCGKVIAYQNKTPDGQCPYLHNTDRTLEDTYMYIDGVSITYGNGPRKHIWSFIAAHGEQYRSCKGCPCFTGYSGTTIPFIGNKYFCDTASNTTASISDPLYDGDPLWDGDGCGPTNECCSFNNPPWFCTELEESTVNEIELRLCGDEYTGNEDVPIESMELYVQ